MKPETHQIFKKSQRFREDMYLTLLANSSMCLMKLELYEKAKMVLERMFRMGESRLKLYLRLAKCMENQKNYAGSYQVLDKRALRAFQRERDPQLQDMYVKMKNRIYKLLKVEESKQEQLFRKCYNLKKKDSGLSEKGPLTLVTEIGEFPLWKRVCWVGLKWLGALAVGCASSYLLMRFCGGESLNREILLGNTALSLVLLESWQRRPRVEWTLNLMLVVVVNTFWVRQCYKRIYF